jgi:AcrR family transcriptional regulator
MESRRRQRNHDRMVQEILDTARAIMREEGTAALSMQELARRLDMRAPSLYNYFNGKMEIYDAVFRLGFSLFATHMAARTAGARTWQEYLRTSLEAYMSFAMENPELYQLCFERPVPGFVPSPESLEISFGALHRGYAQLAAWQKDVHSGLSIQQTADLALAMMHGLTALHMANEPALPLGEGRFGPLTAAAVDLFERAWARPTHQEGANP